MAYTEFFVTKGTSASDVNGGGPNLGANDGPIVTRANCASDGAGTTITDSDGGGWGTAAADDWICFDTAGAKDFARITNVAGNNLTVTPAVTINQAGKTVNVGGAWATVDHAASTVSSTFLNAANAPARVNIKYSATAYAEAVVNDHAGPNGQLTFEGYYSTPGDECDNAGTWTPPKIDSTAAGGGRVWYLMGLVYITVKDIYLYTTAANEEALVGGGLGCIAIRLRIYCPNADSYAVSDVPSVMNCWFENTGATAVSNCRMVLGCYFENISGYGILVMPYHNAVGNIINAPSNDCIYVFRDSDLIAGNVCYGSVAGSGIWFEDITWEQRPLVFNNILVGNNQYGIEVAQMGLGWAGYNAFYNNGVAEVKNVMGVASGNHPSPNSVTLTGDPFTNAGVDFSLNDTAGAGAACRDAGYPGTMIDGTQVGHVDIGALQHDDPAGGGAVRSPIGLTGGIHG